MITDPPPGSPNDSSTLREAIVRRFHRRLTATGQITMPAVPGLVDEHVKVCEDLFASMGVRYTAEQSAQLRAVFEDELGKAFTASPRSNVVLSFEVPFGTNLNYRVTAEWLPIEGAYDQWVATREPPLFGSEPDARVWALAGEVADPASSPVLDIGAGTGRNALALARRGHPVDAVEMTPKFAHIIRWEAQQHALPVRVVQSDVFATTDGLGSEYRLIVVSEVVPDFRTTQQLREMFELAARCLAPGGRMVFNTFLARQGYVPDDTALELGQQCNTMIFTRQDMDDAAARLPLDLVADDSAYEYEKAHLPDSAWPPTGWFENWAHGLDVFDVPAGESPIELRWLVYQKTG